VNLEMFFTGGEPSALDEYLAEIDHALDTLFLEEIEETLDRIRAERLARPDDAPAWPAAS